MNVLVISNAAWGDKNSSGNTYSNLVEGWKGSTFHSLYSREVLPNNQCCTTYCCVSPFNLAKNIFTPWKIGNVFHQEDVSKQITSADSEQNAKNNVHGFKKNMILLLVDLMYLSGFWLNSKIKQYIHDCNPDVVMMTGVSEAYRYKLAKYVKKHTNAKLVTYIVDDTYNTEKNSGTILGWLRSKRYKHIFSMSDKVYGISNEMCKAYSEEFNCDVSLLTKGCELGDSKKDVNTPIEIVYAGNLLYGRDVILVEVATNLHEINKECTKAVLRIYTGTAISTSLSEKLNLGVSSQICGSRPYEEIKEIMKHADIVLHVESFEPEQMRLVRYSFSTKITDCLQSGSVMMAIGPKGISSIEYPKQIPGAIVVDDLTQIKANLLSVINNSNSLVQKAKESSAFAKEHHDISKVRENLQNAFKLLVNEKK